MIEGNDLAENYILGDSFHQSYLSTYDLEYKYVGFAPHIYSNSTITTSKMTRGIMITAIVEGVIFLLIILWGISFISRDYCYGRLRLYRWEQKQKQI